jgi:hypothetical protein
VGLLMSSGGEVHTARTQSGRLTWQTHMCDLLLHTGTSTGFTVGQHSPLGLVHLVPKCVVCCDL